MPSLFSGSIASTDLARLLTVAQSSAVSLVGLVKKALYLSL